jgi:hypothetical protein
MWSRHIPPDQVHIVTVPHQDPGSLLWTRFAAALDIDPGGCDATRGRRNPSLGYAETEFLRRMNEGLQAEMPDWFYAREIKQILAHGVLSDRPHHAPLVLPPGHAAWAAEQAEILLAGLSDAKYHIVGDLADLRPAGEAGAHASPAGRPAVEPAELQLEAAVQSAVALADRYYQVLYPVRQREPHRGARQRASDIKWAVLNGPAVRRVLRGASHRAAVRRLRVLIWRVLMRPGRPRQG